MVYLFVKIILSKVSLHLKKTDESKKDGLWIGNQTSQSHKNDGWNVKKVPENCYHTSSCTFNIIPN